MTARATWLSGLATASALAAAPGMCGAPESQAEDAEAGEVIVTARKIRENVQAIPMSVQVLTAPLLNEGGATRLFELQFNIPGLVLNSTGFQGAGFSLRGVADQLGTGASVATHLDGVYLGTSNLAITRMFDLERVEILKGPQGTLYGRNSTAGSINFITKAPQDTRSALVEAAYGSFRTKRMQGHVNLPLDKGALRLAFIGSEGDGYIRNAVDDRRFGENDYWGLRASLRIDASDRLKFDLMAQRVADDGASGELWMQVPGDLADPSDIRLAIVNLPNPYLSIETTNASLNTEYDYGFATLHLVTGYASETTRDLDDCFGNARLTGCIRSMTPLKYDQWSQEIRLASHHGPLEWLVGGYYLNSDESRRYYQFVPARGSRPMNDYSSDTDRSATALFGQATVHVGKRSRITAGLRLSHEKMRTFVDGTGFEDPPPRTAAEDSWDGTSWRLDLEHDLGTDALAYAGVSTGFKSGGITNTARSNGELDGFDPEKLTAVEAGLKTQWLNRRLTANVAAFHYDFRDMQISAIYNEKLETANAAQSEIYGIDTSFEIHAADRLTFSAGAVWMPKREFIEYRNPRSGDVLSGNKLSRAPQWSATSAVSYRQPLRDVGTLSMRLEYNYRSSFFFSQENDAVLAQDAFGLLNAFLRFEPAGSRWYVFASGRNLTNAEYFNQILLQASPGYPDTYEIGFGARF